jgi:hypothetical protein
MHCKQAGEGNRPRKRPEPLPPEALDAPFGPPLAAELSRCPGCGEARLVNAARREVALGAAKFRGAHPGGRPRIGCPGGNGETMEDREQEP